MDDEVEGRAGCDDVREGARGRDVGHDAEIEFPWRGGGEVL